MANPDYVVHLILKHKMDVHDIAAYFTLGLMYDAHKAMHEDNDPEFMEPHDHAEN